MKDKRLYLRKALQGYKYLYVMYSQNLGALKVGRTNNLSRRKSELKWKIPGCKDIQIVDFVLLREKDAKRLEQELLETFDTKVSLELDPKYGHQGQGEFRKAQSLEHTLNIMRKIQNRENFEKQVTINEELKYD